ncbi:RNA methyltransferase [Alkalibaculum sp. M08DMB]|uniref:RNA methyltransferase n=1 Tax=Alkalibaculum sporogenes TaxID=2655001 RepID=A0A6A7K6P6_9FIRM|nr:RNA methyltransferase [Alkalibaculum sporogenes]MPW25110.1 RNA methyltransferase [Alkalibaculum sporogenes]
MNIIESNSNKHVKHILKLKAKKYREQYKEFILEGLKLIDEAIIAKENIRAIYVSSSNINDLKVEIENYKEMYPIFIVEENIFKKLTSMQNSEGVLAINRFQDERELDDSNVIILDRVQDPGNLGTIIRTGDAAGFNNIICGEGCVDIYNEKTIRASMGSLFHVNLRKDVDILNEIVNLKQAGYIVIGSDLGTDYYYTDLCEKKKYVLVIGNESNGIKEEILNICDERIKIPIYGQAESLNASVAAGILMYYIASL